MRPPDPSTLPREMHPEKVRRDAIVLLASVRSTLADLLQQVMEGEGGALKDLTVKQAELETALKRAFEAEARYGDWQAKQGGEDLSAVEIDFEALRHDISCRIARIRDCCEE